MSEKKHYLKEGITAKPCPSCSKPMWFDQNTGNYYCRNPNCPSKRKP
jgi:NAD-dependent DNA ligase